MAVPTIYDQIRYIELVRSELDELLLIKQSSATDDGMQVTASSRFSDYHIVEKLGQAARYIAANVGAEHLPDLIEDHVAAYKPATQAPFLRMLIRSAELKGVFARRRTFSNVVNMVRRRKKVADTNPIVFYEDAEFRLEGDFVSTSAGDKVSVVRVPLDLSGVSNSAGLVAGSDTVIVQKFKVPAESVGGTIAFSRETGEVVHYAEIIQWVNVKTVKIDPAPDFSEGLGHPRAAVWIYAGARLIPIKFEETIIQIAVGTLVFAVPGMMQDGLKLLQAADVALAPFAALNARLINREAA